MLLIPFHSEPTVTIPLTTPVANRWTIPAVSRKTKGAAFAYDAHKVGRQAISQRGGRADSPCIFTAFAPVLLRAQLSTYDHLTEPGWWPRREPSSLKGFSGNAACAKCR